MQFVLNCLKWRSFNLTWQTLSLWFLSLPCKVSPYINRMHILHKAFAVDWSKFVCCTAKSHTHCLKYILRIKKIWRPSLNWNRKKNKTSREKKKKTKMNKSTIALKASVKFVEWRSRDNVFKTAFNKSTFAWNDLYYIFCFTPFRENFAPIGTSLWPVKGLPKAYFNIG